MKTKEERIQIIQDFIGKDGYVAFEHGFKPDFNAYGVAYDHTDRRIPFNGERKAYFKDMTAEQLNTLILDLVSYENYCRLYA